MMGEGGTAPDPLVSDQGEKAQSSQDLTIQD